MDSLIDISNRLSECLDNGFDASDVVVITPGLTECFKDRMSGRYVIQGTLSPSNPMSALLEFHEATFEENYQNLVAISDLILSRGKTLVLTVSPVPLVRTWSGGDVVLANTTSKTTLRAAVGQLCRERPEIIYWPSFEVTWGRDIYRTLGGLHPHPEVVKEIVSGFLSAMRS